MHLNNSFIATLANLLMDHHLIGLKVFISQT